MDANKDCIYVVRCRDNSLYTGYTNNLKRRIKQHNDGKGAKYTRAKGPVTLVYTQTYPDKSQALKAEAQFKKLSKAKKESIIEEYQNRLKP
ncbi:GIY-YIG nuclease family protein [Streptococcus sp. 10F2]